MNFLLHNVGLCFVIPFLLCVAYLLYLFVSPTLRRKHQVQKAHKLLDTWRGHIDRLGYKPGILVAPPKDFVLSVFNEDFEKYRGHEWLPKEKKTMFFSTVCGEKAFHHAWFPALGPRPSDKMAYPGTSIIDSESVMLLLSLTVSLWTQPTVLPNFFKSNFNHEMGVVFEWKLLLDDKLVEFVCFDLPTAYKRRNGKVPERLPFLERKS